MSVHRLDSHHERSNRVGGSSCQVDEEMFVRPINDSSREFQVGISARNRTPQKATRTGILEEVGNAVEEIVDARRTGGDVIAVILDRVEGSQGVDDAGFVDAVKRPIRPVGCDRSTQAVTSSASLPHPQNAPLLL